MIINIGDHTIDLTKVVRVGPVEGDPAWLRYTVYFEGGSRFKIYEKRFGGPQMKREYFIKLWKESKSNK